MFSYGTPSPARFGDRALHNVFLTTAESATDLSRFAATADSQISSQPLDSNQDDEADGSSANLGGQALHGTSLAMAEDDAELAIYAAIDASLTTSQRLDIDQYDAATDDNISSSRTYPIFQTGSENVTGLTMNVVSHNNNTQGLMTNTILAPITSTVARHQPAISDAYAWDAAGRFAASSSPGLRQQGFEPLDQVTHSLPAEQRFDTTAGAERGTQSQNSSYCPSAAKTQSCDFVPDSTDSHTNETPVNDIHTPAGHLDLPEPLQNQRTSAFSGSSPASPPPYALTLTAEYYKIRGLSAPQDMGSHASAMARVTDGDVAPAATHKVASPSAKPQQQAKQTVSKTVSKVRRGQAPLIAAETTAASKLAKRSTKTTAAKSSTAKSLTASSQSESTAPNASSQSDDATSNSSSSMSSASSASSAPATPPLHFASADEALPHLIVRKPLAIHNDDYQQVELGIVEHVKELRSVIMLVDDYLEEPYDTRKSVSKARQGDDGKFVFTADEKALWKKWQALAIEQITEIHKASQLDVLELAEAKAWHIFDQIILVHKHGYVLSTVTPNPDLKCSDRLSEAVRVIREYPTMRKHIFDTNFNGQACEFASGPQYFMNKGIANVWSNEARKPAHKRVKAGSAQARSNAVPKKKTRGVGTLRKVMTIEEIKKLEKAQRDGEMTPTNLTVAAPAAAAATREHAEDDGDIGENITVAKPKKKSVRRALPKSNGKKTGAAKDLESDDELIESPSPKSKTGGAMKGVLGTKFSDASPDPRSAAKSKPRKEHAIATKKSGRPTPVCRAAINKAGETQTEFPAPTTIGSKKRGVAAVTEVDDSVAKRTRTKKNPNWRPANGFRNPSLE